MAIQSNNIRCGLLLATLLIAQSGCANKNLFNWNRDKTPVADARNPVRKMVCIWEPKQGQGLDGLPTRGFAGNIMFFTNASPKPATSAGDVRVYLFHDRGTPEEQAKPIHQFDFKGKAWATHLKESVPGPSYRIFIPYVDKQPWQVTCGLRVRLTPPGGQPVYSEMVHVRLPGPAQSAPEEADDSPQQLTIPRKAIDVSDFQLGATIRRERGPTVRETAVAPGNLDASPASPLRPGLDSPNGNPGGDDLQQLLQQTVSDSPRELVRGTAPAEPESFRRFKMSPAAMGTPHNDAETVVPQPVIPPEMSPTPRNSSSLAHPLTGF